MPFNQIDRDDPRYDPSSLVVKVDGDEIEWIAISYGDDTDIQLARAGGTPFVVGDGPGAYMPQGGSLRMHKDKAAQYMRELYGDAIQQGAIRVSAIRHIITVSYAEWNMATLTDTLIAVRFKGQQPGGQEGGTSALSTVEIPFTFTRIKWDGDVQM